MQATANLSRIATIRPVGMLMSVIVTVAVVVGSFMARQSTSERTVSMQESYR